MHLIIFNHIKKSSKERIFLEIVFSFIFVHKKVRILSKNAMGQSFMNDYIIVINDILNDKNLKHLTNQLLNIKDLVQIKKLKLIQYYYWDPIKI